MRYIGILNAPSLSPSYWENHAEGFDSLDHARDYLRSVHQGGNWAYPRRVDWFEANGKHYASPATDGDGFGGSVHFPTDEVTLTLARVTTDRETLEEWIGYADYMLSVGPRGGIVTESL